ncbi:MAG TPA: MMPL family transporter [Planctomycetaceae bacterium]|nr:MMPL family transporter [Planctomycetaceae bacterium]
MALLVPVAGWSVLHIELENDIHSWLPADDPQAFLFEWSKEHFPSDDNLLISWDGSSLDDPRLERLRDQLAGVADAQGVRRGGLNQVASVLSPHDLIERMESQGVARDEALRRTTGVLVSSGPLKIRLTAAGRRDATGTRDLLVRQVRKTLDYDVRAAEPGPHPHASASNDAPAYDFEIIWRGMHLEPDTVDKVRELAASLRTGGEVLVDDCFFIPGAPVALSVVLTESGGATPKETVQAIRQAAVAAGIDADSLRLGGRVVTGAELDREVNSTIWNSEAPWWPLHKRSLLLLSALVSVVLAFVMLRSVRLALLVLFVANFATLQAMALVPMTYGSMNMVLMVMPTLLTVLTLSAAIHVVNYWKHAACRDYRTAVAESFRMARQPCMLAGLTTAIGMVSLLTSPLTPVRDLGLYSAIGCLISLVVVLFGLPALLHFWSGPAPREADLDASRWARLGAVLNRRWKIASAVCLAAFALGAYGLTHFQTEIKVIRFFDGDSRVVEDYDFLEENLAGLVPVEMIVRFDGEAQQELDFLQRMELVRNVQNRMRRHPEISGSLSLADFMQPHQPPDAESSLPSRLAWNRRLYEMERRIKDPQVGAAAFVSTVRRTVHLQTAHDRSVTIHQGDELWRITAQVAMLSDYDYADLTGDWNNPRSKPGDLNRVALAALEGQPGVDHMLTGMVPLFLRTQQAVLESLIRSFGLAFGVIAIVMMVLLRNPWAGALSMLPNLLPVVVVFGAISWAGLAIDMGTMITASVALGIAVDGTLHLLTWFRAGLQAGCTRHESILRALGHCGPAMWQTSAAIALGLLVLIPADLLLISRFGWLMAALIFAALIADLVLLPALLAGPLGGLIERTYAAAAPESEADDVSEAVACPALVALPAPSPAAAGGFE